MDPFPIINISGKHQDTIEQLGSKPKFWFQGEDGNRYLFKEGRPNTGENWSEKVVGELCSMLSLPHVHYELAEWEGKRGVICESFVPGDGRLIHGNELLFALHPEYQKTRLYGVREYSLIHVIAALRLFRPRAPLGWLPIDGADSGIGVFVGYLLLDTWIANQDRHHENWGVILTSQGGIHLTPTYDHASGLGAIETDENRAERLVTKDTGRSMPYYVSRALSAFYAHPGAKRLSTVDSFTEIANRYPKAASAWLERLSNINPDNVRDIFSKVPKNLITRVAIDFSLKILELNKARLLSIGEDLKK
jgi:hypothetical protein